MKNRQEFYKAATVFADTHEQEDACLLAALDRLGVRHEPWKLDVGDHRFRVEWIARAGQC